MTAGYQLIVRLGKPPAVTLMRLADSKEVEWTGADVARICDAIGRAHAAPLGLGNRYLQQLFDVRLGEQK